MCGIAGKISWNTKPDPEIIRRMTDTMKTRGPDAEGIYSSEHAALGHRRLSIIDLSDSARQPMADTSSRYRLVYNGEIYNFAYLKKKLIAYGSEFRTSSDSEVIIEAYKKWGSDCVARFLIDPRRRKCFNDKQVADRSVKSPCFDDDGAI